MPNLPAKVGKGVIVFTETEAAIDSMKDNNVSAKIKEAAYATFEGALELGKEY